MEFGKRYTVYAPSLDELREKEDDLEAEIRDGLRRRSGDVTVCEQTELYFSLKDGLRYSTQRNYNSLQNILEGSEFGQLPLGSVKSSMVKRFYIQLRKEGYGYEVISKIHCHLKLAFLQALEDDIIAKNPIMFKFSSVIKDDRSKVTSLSDEEKDRLLEFIRGHGDFRKHYDVFIILLGTGMRISELCGLTLRDLDFANGRISVNKQLRRKNNGELYIEATKTKASERIIPMTPAVKTALQNVIRSRNVNGVEWIVDGVSGFLFVNRDGRPKTSTTFDKSFSCIRKSYNKKYQTDIRLTPHVLRHTFCTSIVNSGMNIKSAQYITGHASAKILLDVYVDVKYDTVEREFAEAVAGGRL
jgi:integrase